MDLQGDSIRSIVDKELTHQISIRRSQKFLWGVDMLSALNHMHTKGVFHRDLKCANILQQLSTGTTPARSRSGKEKHTRAILCDLGMARVGEVIITNSMAGSAVKGTPGFLSPEQLEMHVLTSASDVYTWAVTMWEMCTMETPWKGLNWMAVGRKVLDGKKKLPLDFLETERYPDDFQDLLHNCWDLDPEQRPAIKDMLVLMNAMFKQQCQTEALE